MAAYQKTLVDKAGNQIVPRTRVDAITFDGVTPLEDHLVTFTDEFVAEPMPIDADLLDGKDSSEFATSTHLHDDRYSLNTHSHTFAEATSKPTTLSGYGITNGVQAMITGLKLWKGTQAEYDAIGTKDSLTVYIIV